MSFLTAMQSASMRLVGQRPSVFFSSQNTFEQEIVDIANDVASDILQYNDWQSLTKIHTITGDGTTTDFNFPSDYGRQLLNTDMQDMNNWAWGYEHITDMNTFIYRRARGFQPYPGAWIIYGDQFHFYPAPAADQSATFPYISRFYAKSNAGVSKEAFAADDDTFALPDDLLTLGVIWKWRENKKFDYTGDQENFVQRIEQVAAKEKGSRIMRSRRHWGGAGVSLAYPWTLG